jgi:site-specific recombinase XerD
MKRSLRKQAGGALREEGAMDIVECIEQEMLSELDNQQMERLDDILRHYLRDVQAGASEEPECRGNEDFLGSFIAAKKMEGCSKKTLDFYSCTVKRMLDKVGKPAKRIATEDLRKYLAGCQGGRGAGNVTMDNFRRILCNFFTWMEEESFIMKSPMRRIHKIKSGKAVKETYSDDSLELMREKCETPRDRAIISLLASSGMRVGELVKLDRSDIDFNLREGAVLGKGDKERIIYFDARAKLHLLDYLESRTDGNPALFATLRKPYARLGIGGVETLLRQLSEKLGISKVHPHKFRRTLATMAIDKGMPIEQVQRLLGHEKIDAALGCAMVNQKNVKSSHSKYIS